jgi:hypothetical protein
MQVLTHAELGTIVRHPSRVGARSPDNPARGHLAQLVRETSEGELGIARATRAGRSTWITREVPDRRFAVWIVTHAQTTPEEAKTDQKRQSDLHCARVLRGSWRAVSRQVEPRKEDPDMEEMEDKIEKQQLGMEGQENSSYEEKPDMDGSKQKTIKHLCRRTPWTAPCELHKMAPKSMVWGCVGNFGFRPNQQCPVPHNPRREPWTWCLDCALPPRLLLERPSIARAGPAARSRARQGFLRDFGFLPPSELRICPPWPLPHNPAQHMLLAFVPEPSTRALGKQSSRIPGSYLQLCTWTSQQKNPCGRHHAPSTKCGVDGGNGSLALEGKGGGTKGWNGGTVGHEPARMAKPLLAFIILSCLVGRRGLREFGN